VVAVAFDAGHGDFVPGAGEAAPERATGGAQFWVALRYLGTRVSM
jgi:hypothetical protein